jgi:carbon-monoxide dehydrogenase medium subunit
MKPFRVQRPTTVAEAASELGRLGERARLYAGGAELLVLLRQSLIETDTLIDIKGIPDLDDVSFNGLQLRIGANVTHHSLETNPLIREHLPMFAEAESQVANIRVRNQGTLGGNLCFNDPHSDPGAVLLLYDANVALGSKHGERQLALNEFLLGMYATALHPDELLMHIDVEPLSPGWSSAYLRVRRLQRPTIGVAAAAKLVAERVDGVRFGVGCVGPVPKRLTALEEKVRGLKLIEAHQVIEQENDYLKEVLEPVDDLLGTAEYKLYLTGVLLNRALEQAAVGAQREDHDDT